MLTIVTRSKTDDSDYLRVCKDNVSKALIEGVDHKIVLIPDFKDFNRLTLETRHLNEYIALVDHDDLITQDAIDLCVKAIKKYNLDMVFTNEEMYFTDSGKTIKFYTGRRTKRSIVESITSVHHLVVMRTSLISNDILELIEKYNIGAEWFMKCSVMSKGKVANISKVCYTWTRHKEQLSASKSNLYVQHMADMKKDVTKLWNFTVESIPFINPNELK